MAVNIVVPELSESVVEATVSEWVKQIGDAVEVGDVIVILETDKVTLEVTAEQNGVIASITKEADEDVGAGEVLGTLDADGSAAPATPQQQSAPQAAPVAQVATASATTTTEDQKATPVAKRFAAAHDVDLKQVTPDSGKITKNDVQNYLSGSQPAPAQPTAPTAPSVPKSSRASAPAPAPTSMNGASRREERMRMSRRRRTIATRLVEAQHTAAMLTTFNEIDMKAVMDLRSRRKDAFKEKYGVGLGFSSFFVKACIGALKAFPRLNAEIQENDIVLKHYYDIGMAIGADEGLVVPVIHDADRLSFAEIEQAVKDYAIQARDGTLSIEALQGGTFTITNGGVFGSLLSTPILNPPQVGIIGLHGIKERPVVVDGEITIRPMMYVALTYDHRIVDGSEAVRFLVKVKELIEDPETLLIEG